jgi:hypothetical protein
MLPGTMEPYKCVGVRLHLSWRTRKRVCSHLDRKEGLVPIIGILLEETRDQFEVKGGQPHPIKFRCNGVRRQEQALNKIYVQEFKNIFTPSGSSSIPVLRASKQTSSLGGAYTLR